MLLGELAGMLREVTGGDATWAAAIGPETTLDGDLWLDSIELAALGTLMHQRYRVDLPAYLAGLELDQLIALRVNDLIVLLETA